MKNLTLTIYILIVVIFSNCQIKHNTQNQNIEMNEFSKYLDELSEYETKLIEKYSLNKFQFDPEFVYSSKNLKLFGDDLINTLFPLETYEFIKDYTSENKTMYVTEFYFNSKMIRLETETRTDFLTGNLVEVLEELEKHSNMIVVMSPFTGSYFSQTKEILQQAQKEGLPITFEEEFQFWVRNLAGKKINKDEEYRTIIKFQTIALDEIDLNKAFYNGIKSLSKKTKRLDEYNEVQLRITFDDRKNEYRIFVNGDLVSYDNKKISENELSLGFDISCKILLYGLAQEFDNIELTLIPLLRSQDKPTLKMTAKEYCEFIEAQIAN